MRIARAALLAAFCVACASDSPAPVPLAPTLLPTLPPTSFGINIGLLDPPGWDVLHPEWTHATFKEPRTYMRLLAGTGARSVRIPVAWADLADRQTGHLDLTRPEWVRIDTTLSVAGDHGFSVLGVLAHHTWNQPPGYPSLEAWKTFVGEVTQRLQGRVSHWAVWNEPNCDAYLSRGSEPATAEDYAELVRAASPEIRRSGAKVVAGELSWWGEGNVHCRAAGPFLFRTLILAGDAIDVVSITVYKPNSLAIRATIDSARAVMDLVPGNRPLWVTEFGVDREIPNDSLEADVASNILLQPPAGVERFFFWHGFIWNNDDRRGMLRPTDSTIGANHRWIYANPVPRLSYVAHVYARLGCDWQRDCPQAAALLPGVQLTIEGPGIVRPNSTCSWSVHQSAGVWPYSAPAWTIDSATMVGQTLKHRSSQEPFVVEVTQVDALGRQVIARREVSVSRHAAGCKK
jgi:hypothetical protein